MVNTFSIFSNTTQIMEKEIKKNLRLLHAPSAMSLIVGKSECNFTQIAELLGLVKKQIKLLQDITCDKFEQTWTILGEIDQDIFDTRTILCAKFEGTFTTLNNIEQEIIDTRTILCDKFEQTWTILGEIDQDIFDTRTILCNKFEQTWTILGEIDQDIFDTRTILCAKFEGTFTSLDAIEEEVIDTRTILCDKLIQVLDALQSLESCDVNVTHIPIAPLIISSPGVYCLTQNVSIPGGVVAAIIIDSNDVVLDLNNYEIIGPDSGFGILLPESRENITIKNGIIRNFDIGISNPAIGTVSKLTLKSILVRNNTLNGFEFHQAENIVINGCKSCNNGSSGFLFIDSAKCVINSCIANDNEGHGFSFDDCRNIEFEENSACNNSLNGVFFENSSQSLIDLCVSDSNFNGFELFNCASITIKNCEAISSFSIGFFLSGDDTQGCHLRSNIAAFNGGFGFRLFSCNQQIVSNYATMNGFSFMDDDDDGVQNFSPPIGLWADPVNAGGFLFPIVEDPLFNISSCCEL
jgi:parallel beta-helix repeat protein